MDVGNLFVPVFTGRYKCSTTIFVPVKRFFNLFINSKYVQSIYVMQSDVTDSRSKLTNVLCFSNESQ